MFLGFSPGRPFCEKQYSGGTQEQGRGRNAGVQVPALLPASFVNLDEWVSFAKSVCSVLKEKVNRS